jgi:hypothetical protein
MKNCPALTLEAGEAPVTGKNSTAPFAVESSVMVSRGSELLPTVPKTEEIPPHRLKKEYCPG